MKITFTLVLLLHFVCSFPQWTRVQQLPASDIFSLYHRDNTLYAGGKNLVYFSGDKGQTWDSTNTIPQFFEVENIIIHNNELYASCFGIGVVKSMDNGSTWQNINAGISPFVSDFSEFNGDLYAATLGNAVFKLEPVNRTNWSSFSNGLSNQSANITSIAGNSNALIAGTLANGMYGRLAPNSATWEERFLLGQISPSERVDDIVTAHDSLFLSGSTGKFYLSTDNGLTWNRFGNNSLSKLTLLVNAKQAFLAARNIFDGQFDNTLFAYTKKDSLGHPFVVFSFVPDHFTYKIDILADKLWNASSKGLFYMPLSQLPGITAADDSATLISLPVRYISFDLQLKTDKTVRVHWRTADEFNIDHFEVERSADGITWNNLANTFPGVSHDYSNTDSSPQQGENYYRVKAVGIDGKFFYTAIKSVKVENEVKFRAWPNPAHDRIFLDIVTPDASQVLIRIFDNKGALVKIQSTTLLQGSNQLSIETGSLANGLYSLSIDWNNGQIKKTVQVIKQ